MVLKNEKICNTNTEKTFTGNLDFLVFFFLILTNFIVAEILNLSMWFYTTSFLSTVAIFLMELRNVLRKTFILLISLSGLTLISALPILIEVNFSSGFRVHLSNTTIFWKTVFRSWTMISALIILSSKNDIADFVYVLSKFHFNKHFITFFALSYKAIENIYVVFKEVIESQISRNGYASEKTSFKSIILLIQGGMIKTVNRVEDTLLTYESKNIQNIIFLEKDYKLTIKPFIYEIILIFLVVVFHV